VDGPGSFDEVGAFNPVIATAINTALLFMRMLFNGIWRLSNHDE
jgi:hypothetical protein